MATISRRGLFASLLHPDAEDAVAGTTPKPAGVMANRPNGLLGIKNALGGVFSPLTNALETGLDNGAYPGYQKKVAPTQAPVVSPTVATQPVPRGTATAPAPSAATFSPLRPAGVMGGVSASVVQPQPKMNLPQESVVGAGVANLNSMGLALPPTQAPSTLDRTMRQTAEVPAVAPVDPVRQGQQAPAVGSGATTVSPANTPRIFPSDAGKQGVYNMGDFGKGDPRFTETDANGVPLGQTMVPVAGIGGTRTASGQKVNPLTGLPTTERVTSSGSSYAQVGVPTGQTIGRGVMTARSNSLDRNLDEYGRGQDTTPYAPNAATNQIAAEMKAKNAAIDAKAGGAISGTGILGRMARNLDPRERASLALEQRFRNVDQPAAEARNAAELSLERERTEGKRVANEAAAEKSAIGAQAIADAERFRQENADAVRRGLMEDSQRNAMETAFFTARERLNALQTGKPTAAKFPQKEDLDEAMAKWNEEKAKAEAELEKLIAQRREMFKGGGKQDGSGGGGLDGIPTWRPTKLPTK